MSVLFHMQRKRPKRSLKGISMTRIAYGSTKIGIVLLTFILIISF